MTLDIERMRRIAEDLYVVAVSQAFGAEGTHALRTLIDYLIRIYQRVDPSLRTEPLIVFIGLPSRTGPEIVGKSTVRIAGVDLIVHELDGLCCVQLAGGDELLVRPGKDVDVQSLSSVGIVYVLRERRESFIVNGVSYAITNPASTHASIFARPTFSSLKAALESYRVRVARVTACEILKQVWADERRLYLRAKPEATMRKSLNQFLANVLQDAEVRPEQNVDESKPVDIKVTWITSFQRAIIEIKWLGDSKADDGSVATCYRDSRANDGAKQLADYLDSSATWGGSVHTRGFLTVFDARRRGLDPSVPTISAADGMHYKDRDIDYDPDYSAHRPDFDRPSRFFMNPICD
jgi:hypothetical protein